MKPVINIGFDHNTDFPLFLAGFRLPVVFMVFEQASPFATHPENPKYRVIWRRIRMNRACSTPLTTKDYSARKMWGEEMKTLEIDWLG